MDKAYIGKMGEDFCAAYYANNGFKIVKRNFHSRYGEIDVIAENENLIVFVEVKTRSENQSLEGKDAVTLSKQRKIVLTALSYMENIKIEKTLRFDVFEVLHNCGKPVKFRKTESAFEADERVLGNYSF